MARFRSCIHRDVLHYVHLNETIWNTLDPVLYTFRTPEPWQGCIESLVERTTPCSSSVDEAWFHHLRQGFSTKSRTDQHWNAVVGGLVSVYSCSLLGTANFWRFRVWPLPESVEHCCAFPGLSRVFPEHDKQAFQNWLVKHTNWWLNGRL